MNGHLNIKLAGQDVALPPDFELNFHDQNPLFNKSEMWSEPMAIPVDGNRQVLENIDVPESGKRSTAYDKIEAQVEVDGVPVRHGYSRVQDNTLIDGKLDVNIDQSVQSFDDLIGDLECRDVPLKDRLKIGEKVGEVDINVDYLYQCVITYMEQDKKPEKTEYYLGISPASAHALFEPQALGFSQPGVTKPASNDHFYMGEMFEQQWQDYTPHKTYQDGHEVKIPVFEVDFTNVSEPYDSTVNSPYKDESGGTLGWPFCNARIAYTHYKKKDDVEETSDQVDLTTTYQQYENFGPYWVLDARRPQTGVCFYVLYFLDCLFKHLGVTFDNSELLKVEDLKHLAFFTTHCRYDSVYEGGETFSGNLDKITEAVDVIGRIGWPPSHITSRKEFKENYTEEEYNKIVFNSVNTWLEERGCGGKLAVPKPATKSVQNFTYKDKNGNATEVIVGKKDVQSVDFEARISKISYTAKVVSMYANSDNFPEASVKDVIDSLEASFGIRFVYDYERRHVKAYFIRDVFHTTTAPVKIQGKILSVTPLTDLTSGVRMKYNNEGTDKEQRQNVKQGIRDYDTDYDYIDYPEKRVVVGLDYDEIKRQVKSNNMYVYVDMNTGNAYRIKVDSETLGKPVLFEVGQFKGIEVGDCSKENEDHVVEYVSNFVPVPFNRVSAYLEQAEANCSKDGGTDGHGYYVFEGGDSIGDFNKNLKPTYSAFADVQMEHEFIQHRVDNVLDNQFVEVVCSEVLELVESYDPTQTDDGNSPLQEYDWGLAVAFMRGGGANMTIQHYDYNFDGFTNSKWKTTAGDYQMSSDSMTVEGEDYDYNGDGGGERLSLKIRAWKPFLFYIDDAGKTHLTYDLSLAGQQVEGVSGKTWLIPCLSDEVSMEDPTKIVRRIKSRGLADTMMSEIIHFLLHKQPLQIKMEMTAAELCDIPNHWHERVQVGDMIGFIDDVEWSASMQNGLSDVTMKFYYI